MAYIWLCMMKKTSNFKPSLTEEKWHKLASLLSDNTI